MKHFTFCEHCHENTEHSVIEYKQDFFIFGITIDINLHSAVCQKCFTEISITSEEDKNEEISKRYYEITQRTLNSDKSERFRTMMHQENENRVSYSLKVIENALEMMTPHERLKAIKRIESLAKMERK